MKYPRIYRAVMETPWAIQESKLLAIVEFLEYQAAGGKFSPEEIQAKIGAAQQPQGSNGGAIAVLPVFGVISQRVDMMSAMSGGTSTEGFGRAFQQALSDPSVSSIILNIDSPGGSVYGVQELTDTIYAARGQKPIVAQANSLAASAAYWIASAADEIVVTPSGEVGSIGVIAVHEETSTLDERIGLKVTVMTAGKFKGEGNPYEPLSDDAKSAIEGRLQDYYGAFTSAVARGRGVSAADVRTGFGQGRVVGAQQAVKLGMADRVATLDETIARLANPRSRARVGQRAEDEPARLAVVEDIWVPTDDIRVAEDSDAGRESLLADLDYRRRRARLHAV
jgi:signal peptide peptidase SppA